MKKGASWKKRAVLVYCGNEVEGKQTSACLILYDNYENAEKLGEKKAKKIIQLVGAKIEEPTYASPVGSHGTSPGSSSSLTDKSCHFLVMEKNEFHEFQCDSADMKVHWLKLLTLLAMFPYSVIPEEPQLNPISESFRAKLDPKLYGADSAWAVYIMPEEVGSRCQMIGRLILLLKGGVPNQSVGKLEIISPTDAGNPIVSWDRDKMRRTGKTGNLVFIEIGRRCRGGPGLVWMYAGFEEAHPLRETLHRFLFQGDGKAVSIPTHESGIYSRPRSSVDMSLPSSYQKDQSVSRGYQYHDIPPNRLREDSGFKDSPISHSASPAQDVPPPIRLDKHPSIRKQRSTPCRVPRSTTSSRCSTSPSESCDPSHSYGQSVGSFNGEEIFEERVVTSRQSASPTDEGYSEENDESGSGQFRMDPELLDHGRRGSETTTQKSTMRVQFPQRSYTAPSGSHIYEKMVHPNAPLYQEGYVEMIPAGGAGGAMAIQRPAVPSHYDVPPPFRKKPVPNGDSSLSSSSSPSNYENCSSLPTIEEAPTRRQQSEVYENFPRPAKLREESFVNYQPNYENMDAFNEQRRHSESYQNVVLIEDDQKQVPFRSRCRSMEKGEYSRPTRDKNSTPPSNEMHFEYAEHHNRSSVDIPTLPPRVPVVRENATMV
jgi:hypothetical protein